MSKIAFMFPGQGAQYVGMGKEFYENNEKSRQIYEQASAAVGLDIEALCFEENTDINITEYTQIAMLTTEVAMTQAVLDLGVKPDVTGGLSLGEYSALVASGVMDFEDCAKVVRKRGIYMQDEVPAGEGGMAAIIAMDADKILEVLEKVDGIVGIANYNCPGQIAISGEKGEVKDLLAAQVSNSVKWIQCVEAMLADGVDTFIEIGPGRTLSSFVKKINKEVTIVNVDKYADLDKVKELLA